MQERMVGTRRFVVLLLGCLALSVAWSRVIHVDAVAGLGGDGASWAMALNSLQEALARARAGDQVWVAQGSYWPEQPISTDPELLPAATFHLSPGVFLYGGFAGYEADPEERNRIDVNDDGVVDPWEFMTPTVLSAHPDYPGTVLAVRNTSDGELTVADGVCLRGGRTTGAGGGASLGGNTVMRNCRIENNVAASGGGAHLYDGARGYRCLFSGNALYDPESGVGGGLLLESEAVLRESLVCANRHGGVALRLNSEAAFCTVAGNQSTLYGSGVRGDGGRLDSCVIWGNTGSVCQLWGEVALSNSAVQGGYGGDTIPLQGENHGSSGCAGNDNRPECCYPCFRNPEAGDYHLNAGSYLLRRGADDSVSGFPADIGCFQAGLPGNLCGGVGMTLPLMYARPVALNLRVGPRTPAGVVMHLLEAGQPLAMGSMRSGWQWCPAAAGASDLRLVLEVPEQNAVWNSAEVSIRREVAPRLLRVAADDLIWPWNAELPELTWRVVAGSLVEPDRLIGALAVVDNSALSPAFEIGPGSLTVMDGNYGLNYDLQFQPGTLLRTNGEATLSLAGLQSEYTASPVPVRVETLPVGLNLRVTYEGINGTDYPLSLQAPVHVGEYQVNVTVDDPIFYGDAAGILTINKAVLFCQPADAQRASGASNPDFLLIYNGFCGDDGVGVLTPPQIVCYADRQSPEGDYMLALTGGQARDYRMEFVPGVLRIRRTVPRLNEALIMAGMYGQKLGQLEIMAYAVDPRDDRFVPGVLLWEQAGLRLPAGCWAEPWHFVPDDLFTYATVTGSGTVCLQPRPLQAAADLRQKVYGEADPPLSVRVTAGTLISGDLFSGALQREPGEAAGAYAITAGTLTLGGNYLLEIIPAMLTILPRPVEVMVLSQRKASGRPDPTLQWSVGHGSLAGWDAWNGAPERLPGETVGEYPYTRGSLQITGPHGGGNNYRFSLVVGELTVFDGTLQFVDGTMPLMEVVYGTPLSSALVTAQPVLVATGNVMPGTVIWEREGEVFGAGEWELRWEFRPDDPVSCSPFGGIQTVQVQKATLQVSLCGSPVSWVYATPLPELRLDITGFANADDQSCLDELPVALAPIDPALRPGDYPVAIQAGVAANYEFAAQPGVLCVLPDGLQADGITATSLVYGDCLGEARLEGEVRAVSSGLPVAGTLAWQEPESHPDTGTTITAWRFVPVMIGCYEELQGMVAVQTMPRPITVQALSSDKIYGEADPVWEYAVTAGTLLPGDAFSGVLQREAGAICGTYLITSGTLQLNHHYELQFEPALLTIQPRAITIRIQDVTRPYGEANPLWAWEVSAGRLVGDDQPTGEPVVVDGDRPGQVPIAVGTLNFGLNYQATIIPGVLTIVPASVQADAVTTGNGVHGQPLGAVVLNGIFCTQSGVAVPGVLSWQDPTRELTEGTSLEEWIFRPTDAEAYTEVRGIAQVFCGTARLQVSANAQIMEYGSEMPELTWTISAGGLRPGEEITGTLARGESQDDGHTFAIVRGSLTPPPGYELEVIPGVLTVQPRPLTVNAVALTMLYGEETPVLRYEISQGSLVPGDAFSGELSCPHGGEVGTYSIESGTLALGPFYQMEYVGALLQVQSRPVRVQADGAQKIYGQNDPALTYRISAGTLVPGDAFSGSLQRELGEAAGDYPIQQGTLRLNDNYRLEYVPGVYRILPQPLTVIADNQQKLQGEDDPEWTWVFGATGNLSGQSLTGALSRDPGEGAGEYLIRPGNLAVPANYTLDFVPGRLTILPPAHVIHDLQATTLTYGEPLSASSLSAEIIFSDGQIHCEGNFAWGEPEFLPESGSASHPWQFTFFDNAWEPLQGNAMVTVLPRLLPVQGENVEKLVGEPEPPFTYSYDSALLVRAQDTASGSLGRQPGEIPGMYAYILGDLSFGPNYRIVLQGGSLSICLPQIAVDDDWSGKTNGEVVTYDGYQFIYGYNAYATLQEALPLAASGGEIILLPGRYLPVDDGWTLSRPVRLHGQRLDLEGPILQGTLAVCGNRASGSEISGVSLLPENGCLPGPALSLSEARQVILRDCIVANFAYGVQLGGSAQASMIDSLLECQRCCIQIGTPEAPAAGHGLTLSGNLLRSTADKDDAYLHIALYDAAVNGSGRLLLWNNTVADVSLYAPPAEEVAVQLRTDIGDRERPGWPDAGVVVLDKPSAVLQLDQTVWALGTSVLSGLLCDETGQGLAGLSFDVCWLDGENEILRQTVHSDANGEIMLPVGALYVGCYQVYCEMSENLDYYLEPTTRTCVVEEVMPTGLLLRTTVLPAHVASGSQLTVEVIGTFAEWSWEVTNLASLRVTHEAGGSFTGNAYLADKVGGWLMTAEYAGLTAELPFSVTAGPFHHYCVSWDQPVLYAGQIGTFSRVRHDVGHNPNPTGQIPDAVFNSTPYGSGIVSNNVIFANYKSAGTSLNLSWTCMQYQPGTLSSVVVPLDVPLLPWHAYVDSDKYPYTFLYHRATSRLVGITSGIWYAIDNSSVEVCFNLEKNSQDPKSFVITVTGCRIAGVEYPLGVNRLAAFVLTSMSRRYEVRGERTDVTFVPQNPAWPALFSYLRNGVIEFGFLEKYNQ